MAAKDCGSPDRDFNNVQLREVKTRDYEICILNVQESLPLVKVTGRLEQLRAGILVSQSFRRISGVCCSVVRSRGIEGGTLIIQDIRVLN